MSLTRTQAQTERLESFHQYWWHKIRRVKWFYRPIWLVNRAWGQNTWAWVLSSMTKGQLPQYLLDWRPKQGKRFRLQNTTCPHVTFWMMRGASSSPVRRDMVISRFRREAKATKEILNYWQCRATQSKFLLHSYCPASSASQCVEPRKPYWMFGWLPMTSFVYLWCLL